MKDLIMMTKEVGPITPEEMKERFDQWKEENKMAMSAGYKPIPHPSTVEYDSVVYLYIKYTEPSSM